MDKDLRKLLWILFVFFVFGGFSAIKVLIGGSFEIIKAIWHIQKYEIIKGIVLSPKMLTVFFVSLLTVGGVFVSLKGKKRIYYMITAILSCIDLILFFT